MKTPQFKHAKNILTMLNSSMAYTSLKWQLYQSMGYLPATNAFSEVQELLDVRKSDINSAEWLIEGDNSTFLEIKQLHNLRGFLYYDVKDFSDMVNALNHVFSNRLVGIIAYEPTLGTDIISKPFGGIQLVYNATESLMKDYVENIKEVHLFSWNKVPGDDSDILLRYLNNHHGVDWVCSTNKIRKSDDRKTICITDDAKMVKIVITDEEKVTLKIDDLVVRIHDLKVKNESGELNIYEYFEYDGLVVFGFDNRAVSYPSLVHYPSYAEHDLEYLILLAHEAYHILRPKVKVSKGTNKELRSIQSSLQEELAEIAPLYTSEIIRDKDAPQELTSRVLADELLADIYATIVGGESYPKILCDYYLPIMLDTLSESESKYCVFTVGSLKIRTAVTTLKAINCNYKYDHIKDIIEEVNDKIRDWEERSLEIALKQVEITELKNSGLYDIMDKLDQICKGIEDKGIPMKMLGVIERPYYPNDEGKRKKLRKKIEEVTEILSGDPTPEDMATIWEGGVIRPRHLISLIAQKGARENPINRNAILLSLGYHKNILDRFTSQSGDF